MTSDDKAPMVRCPGCPLELAEDDFAAQQAHMMLEHPEIVEARLVESHRYDGWEQD